MIYAITGMGLFFIALAFVVDVSNARHLLSGYNTMSEENRKKVDIRLLIAHLKRFHIFLGISFIVFGVALTSLIGEIAGGVFLAVYPILAYMFFIFDSRKFSKGLSPGRHRVAMGVLAATLIFVAVLFVMGLREDKMILSETITLEGLYGEEFTTGEILTVTLAHRLPPISAKTNGFAMGVIRKGYFRTGEGEAVKLILNSDHMPCILFTLSSGKKIYYAARKLSGETIFDEIRHAYPDLDYIR